MTLPTDGNHKQRPSGPPLEVGPRRVVPGSRTCGGSATGESPLQLHPWQERAWVDGVSRPSPSRLKCLGIQFLKIHQPGEILEISLVFLALTGDAS